MVRESEAVIFFPVEFMETPLQNCEEDTTGEWRYNLYNNSFLNKALTK